VAAARTHPDTMADWDGPVIAVLLNIVAQRDAFFP